MTAVEDRRGSTRAAGVVGMAILSSRILGLIREMVFAGLFGAGRNLDAFLMAFRLPNLLRDLFAEGALSTAFITTFSKKIAVEGDKSAWRLANKVATLTAVFMSAVTLLGIMFAPQLVDLLTWGSWPPDKTALTILLTRIMWPFMLLVSMAALVMGILNAKHVFGPPAMASSYFNLGSIIGGVAIGWWLDPHFGARSLTGLAIGTLIGSTWQLIAQLPSLRHVGYRYCADFQWGDEGVRTVLALMGPAVIAASAVQVNVLINSGFAASRQRSGELAQYRLSVDAVAARNFRRCHRHRHAAARREKRGNRQYRRVSRNPCPRNAARLLTHHSFGDWTHHACIADHQRNLSAWTIHR